MSAPSIEQIKTYAAKFASGAKLASIDQKALHTYRALSGTPLYWRIRLKCNSTSDKWIRPFYWTGESFTAGEPPAPVEGKPLYGLERLTVSPDALVIDVEGESCADALNKLLEKSGASGFIAMTSGGAQSAGAADWQPLADRRVIVWPDNDEQGMKYAADVVKALHGIAASVAVLDISGLNLKIKGDVVDWLAGGGDYDGLMTLIDSTRNMSGESDDDRLQSDGEQAGCDSSHSIEHDDATTLQEGAAHSDDEIIRWLASLSMLDYERVREDKARAIGCRAAVLDKLVKGARNEEGDADKLPFAEIEPHPHPIDPAQLLQEVSDTIQRFIVLDKEQAHAAALWVAFTWFIDVVQVAPLAIITAPEMACGKSQLRDLLAKIVMRPLSTNNLKAATLFRIAETWHPSLMLDEVDLMLKSDDEIINLVNAGHHRGASQVWRLVGDNHDPKSFDVWGAKCFAGIALEKIFPASTLSRAIVFKLRRKMQHETVGRLRHASAEVFDVIAEKLARFAQDYSQQVKRARPSLPDELSDRDQDNWEPLLAIASCAGDAWLSRATVAALKLSDAGEKTVSVGNELLADIQHVFESKKLSKISTADLIEGLCEDEELSWSAYNRGKRLGSKQLASRLKEYGIASKNVRFDSYRQAKGYELTQFSDAFARYLCTPESAVPPSQSSANPTSIRADDGTGENHATVARILPVPSEAPYSLPCSDLGREDGKKQVIEITHPKVSHLRI